MLRFYSFICFFFIIISQILGQKSISDSISQSSDSIVYEIDTIVSIDTIEHYIYGAPVEYNVFGFHYDYGKTWLNASNHQNPQTIISPVLFCNFSRGNSLFSIGIQYYSCNERVLYNVKANYLRDTNYKINDTITQYNETINGTTKTLYVIEKKNVTRKDTIIVKTIRNKNSIIKILSIPFLYGFYLKNGYFRVNVGIGITPCIVFTNQINKVQYLLSNKNQVFLLIKPSIELSYWIFSHSFVHFTCAFQHNLTPLVTNEGRNVQINSVLVGVGYSFLFFDKKRE